MLRPGRKRIAASFAGSHPAIRQSACSAPIARSIAAVRTPAGSTSGRARNVITATASRFLALVAFSAANRRPLRRKMLQRPRGRCASGEPGDAPPVPVSSKRRSPSGCVSAIVVEQQQTGVDHESRMPRRRAPDLRMLLDAGAAVGGRRPPGGRRDRRSAPGREPRGTEGEGNSRLRIAPGGAVDGLPARRAETEGRHVQVRPQSEVRRDLRRLQGG